MTRETPLAWRKEWTLHRSTASTDSRGNLKRTWDMEHPDFTGAAGAASGVCWQVKSGASVASGAWTRQELGERASGGATFDLFDAALAIAPFDRCTFGGSVWEVRAVMPRSDHRHVVLEEVRKL